MVSQRDPRSSSSRLHESCLRRDINALRHLLEQGHDPDAVHMGTLRMPASHRVKVLHVKIAESTPLHIAAYMGDSEACACLLQAGASVHAQDDIGRTPLVLAMSGVQLDTFDLLLLAGSDPNVSPVGDLPLAHMALWCDLLDFCASLVRAGADLSRKAPDGRSLLDVAAARGNTPWMLAQIAAANANA